MQTCNTIFGANHLDLQTSVFLQCALFRVVKTIFEFHCISREALTFYQAFFKLYNEAHAFVVYLQKPYKSQVSIGKRERLDEHVLAIKLRNIPSEIFGFSP